MSFTHLLVHDYYKLILYGKIKLTCLTDTAFPLTNTGPQISAAELILRSE